MPALLTRIEMGPKAASACATSLATSSARVTSACSEWTWTLHARSCPEASRSAAPSRPQMATAEPCAARPRAMALPIPRLPPVTSATLPERGLPGCGMFSSMRSMRILPSSGHVFHANLIIFQRAIPQKQVPGTHSRVHRFPARFDEHKSGYTPLFSDRRAPRQTLSELCAKIPPYLRNCGYRNRLRLARAFTYNPKDFERDGNFGPRHFLRSCRQFA